MVIPFLTRLCPATVRNVNKYLPLFHPILKSVHGEILASPLDRSNPDGCQGVGALGLLIHSDLETKTDSWQLPRATGTSHVTHEEEESRAATA